VEGQATQCTVGLSNGLQDTAWNVPISTRLQENLSFVGRVIIQSSLGNQEMEHRPRSRRNEKEDATLRA
jgi:hypothetical protein